MRLDRFITLNLVRPFQDMRSRLSHPRPADGRGAGGEGGNAQPSASSLQPSVALPVLMYHSISGGPEPGVRPYYRVCTGPGRFREQMQWLKDNGCQGVTLGAGLEWQKTGGVSRQWSVVSGQTTGFRPVVLTFDDGFRDFHTAAWPVLREFGFTATMYLPTAFVQNHGPRTTDYRPPSPLRPGRGRGEVSNPNPFINKEFLGWDQISELHRAGIEFGSHTVNHPKLVELPWKQVELEIRKSKLEIEAQLGVPCAAFAYPYAFPQTSRDFVGRLKDLLTASGYASNVTTQLGRHRPGDDALQIKRLPVNQDDDPPLFAAKLAGAYDWLGRFQTVSKNLRRNRNTLACYADHKDQLESLVAAPIAHPDE